MMLNEMANYDADDTRRDIWVEFGSSIKSEFLGAGHLNFTTAAIRSHAYRTVLLGNRICLNGHLCSLDDSENALKYAETQKHLSKFQNAIYGIK